MYLSVIAAKGAIRNPCTTISKAWKNETNFRLFILGIFDCSKFISDKKIYM